MKTRLGEFNPGENHAIGASRLRQLAWSILKPLIFFSPIPLGNKVRIATLTAFGAKIGRGAIIKNRISVLYPWKLTVGENSWLGEEVSVINLENVTIGSNVCISQRAVLCTGNHDYRHPRFKFKNSPIELLDGVWVGACAFVSPGTRVAEDGVVTALTLVSGEIPANTVVSCQKSLISKPRYKP